MSTLSTAIWMVVAVTAIFGVSWAWQHYNVTYVGRPRKPEPSPAHPIATPDGSHWLVPAGHIGKVVRGHHPRGWAVMLSDDVGTTWWYVDEGKPRNRLADSAIGRELKREIDSVNTQRAALDARMTELQRYDTLIGYADPDQLASIPAGTPLEWVESYLDGVTA